MHELGNPNPIQSITLTQAWSLSGCVCCKGMRKSYSFAQIFFESIESQPLDHQGTYRLSLEKVNTRSLWVSFFFLFWKPTYGLKILWILCFCTRWSSVCLGVMPEVFAIPFQVEHYFGAKMSLCIICGVE